MRLSKLMLKLLVALVIAFGFSGFANAASLFPQDVGVWYEYNKHDSADPQNEWTVKLEVLDKVTVGGIEYSKMGEWGYDGPGDYSEFLIRSTETAVYSFDGVNESLSLQIAPEGTQWEFPYTLGGQTGKKVKEIISIEQVTVPYGTFGNAYVHRAYFDFDDSSIGNSPYQYEYIVPNVGLVKEVDYNLRPEELNPPYVQELARVGVNVVLEPVSCVLFLLGAGALGSRSLLRKRRKA